MMKRLLNSFGLKLFGLQSFGLSLLAMLVLALAPLAPAQAALKIQTWTLQNGAKVLFVENHAIPIFDVKVEFDAGIPRARPAPPRSPTPCWHAASVRPRPPWPNPR
jgi:hypothetical protein